MNYQVPSGDADADGHLFLVLPLPIHREQGQWFVEQQALNGLRLWLENFPRVTVACPVADQPVPASSRPIGELENVSRLSVVGLPMAYTPRLFLRALPKVYRTLSQCIEQSRYLQFAIGGLFDWGAVAAWIAHRRGHPFAVWTDRVESEVLRFHAAELRGWRRTYNMLKASAAGRLERSVVRRSSVGLFHGMDTFSVYSPYSSNPKLVHDIHLGHEYRISAEALAAKRSNALSTGLRIVYAGRVHPDKGPRDWVQTLDLVRRSVPDFQATWLGDGPELDSAREAVSAMSLGDQVAFPGRTNEHAAVIAAVREAHIFLFCHKTPESPRCLVEALISGTPILGYGSHYPADLISKHGGGVLTPHEPAALAQAVIDLARDRERLSDLASKAALDGYPMVDELVFRHRSELIKAFADVKRPAPPEELFSPSSPPPPEPAEAAGP